MQFQNAMIFTRSFTFQRGGFRVEDGRFAGVLSPEEPGGVDLGGAYVIPGLIDIHTHGNSGADFCDGDEAGLRRMAAYNGQNGVTAFAPASMTLPYDVLERAFAVGRRVADRRDEGSARLVGINMEGPFFSEKRKGAQNAAYLQLPDFAAFQRLQESCGGLVKLVDLAPELPGAVEFTRQAAAGCTVSVAHTDADYDQAAAVFAAGATHLTHLYNAMPGIHHRTPGPIAAASEREDVMAELIADGVHSHPSAVRLAFKLFPGRICLISDSMRACGMPEGESELGGQKVYLKGRKATLADGTIAGSATNLYDCMTSAISFGIPPQEAVRAATWNPAHEIGMLDDLGSIENGKLADFVVCDGQFRCQRVFIGGQEVKKT